MYLSIYPGDPSTPGYPAYKDAERKEPTNVPGIPALPISWANAQRVLEEIGDVYENRTGRDGRRALTGKTSTSTVKIDNHGIYILLLLPARWNPQLQLVDAKITHLEHDGFDSWPHSGRGRAHRMSQRR